VGQSSAVENESLTHRLEQSLQSVHPRRNLTALDAADLRLTRARPARERLLVEAVALPDGAKEISTSHPKILYQI
jgi:hypothetical protein